MKKLPIKITLFLYKDGEMVFRTSRRFKSKIPYAFRSFQRENGKSAWDYGECTVYYDKPNDFYNKFDFTSAEEFKERFDVCFEPALLKYMEVV